MPMLLNRIQVRIWVQLIKQDINSTLKNVIKYQRINTVTSKEAVKWIQTGPLKMGLCRRSFRKKLPFHFKS